MVLDISTAAANSGQATIDIASNGDVIFIVGPSRQSLRVHSLFVKTASPVFGRMLSLNFEEGFKLDEHGEVEISLPEDNAEAVEIVFNVIHGRNDDIPEALSPNQLLQVAIVCDKYDCFTSLAFAINTWLKITSDPTELWTLAMAAFVFRRQAMFAEATSALVLDHAGSYMDLARKHEAVLDLGLQMKTAAMLEEARNTLRMSLVMDVLSGSWHCGSAGKKGRHRPEWLTEFVRRVGNLDQMAISSILQALDGIETPRPYDEWDVPASGPNQTFKEISDRCRRQHSNKGGLCLWCVKTGEAHEEHSTSN